MNKKILLTALLSAVITNAIADRKPATDEEMKKAEKEALAKAGIVIPESHEVNIVSADKYLNNKSIKQNSNADYMAEKMKEYLAMNEEQQKFGFIKNAEPRAKELLSMKNTAPYHQKKYKEVRSPESSHMRATSDELKLAYTFVGVPSSDVDLNIGIAPFGAYKQVKNGDLGDGWDGAVQFFEKNGIGSCAFTEHNRILAKTGVELIKEMVSYEVQNKPTVILVQGSNDSGFVYKVEWFDSTFSRELECANPKYSQQLRSEVIELAKRIDTFNTAS